MTTAIIKTIHFTSFHPLVVYRVCTQSWIHIFHLATEYKKHEIIAVTYKRAKNGYICKKSTIRLEKLF